MPKPKRQASPGAATQIALLRAINVGGRKKVAMGDLRDFMAELGFQDVRSLLQTGNLVFRSEGRTSGDIERVLEAEASTRLDLDTDVFVRTPEAWAELIARNPFPDEAESDPSHLVVMFLKDTPAAAAVRALPAATQGPELVRADGTQLYIVYPAGIGRSRLTNKLIEDKLGTRGTGRNWNTVLKLDAMVAIPG